MLRKQLRPAIMMTIVLMLITGGSIRETLAFPLAKPKQ